MRDHVRVGVDFCFLLGPRCLFELPGVSRFSSRQYSHYYILPHSPTFSRHLQICGIGVASVASLPPSPSPCVKFLIALRVRLCHYDRHTPAREARRSRTHPIPDHIMLFDATYVYVGICIYGVVLPQHVLRDVTAQCAVPFIISSLTFIQG